MAKQVKQTNKAILTASRVLDGYLNEKRVFPTFDDLLKQLNSDLEAIHTTSGADTRKFVQFTPYNLEGLLKEGGFDRKALYQAWPPGSVRNKERKLKVQSEAIRSLQETVDAIRERLDVMDKTHEHSVVTYTSRFDVHDSRLTALEKGHHNLIQGLDSRLHSHYDRILALEQTMAVLAKKIDDLETLIKS